MTCLSVHIRRRRPLRPAKSVHVIADNLSNIGKMPGSQIGVNRTAPTPVGRALGQPATVPPPELVGSGIGS